MRVFLGQRIDSRRREYIEERISDPGESPQQQHGQEGLSKDHEACRKPDQSRAERDEHVRRETAGGHCY